MRGCSLHRTDRRGKGENKKGKERERVAVKGGMGSGRFKARDLLCCVQRLDFVADTTPEAVAELCVCLGGLCCVLCLLFSSVVQLGILNCRVVLFCAAIMVQVNYAMFHSSCLSPPYLPGLNFSSLLMAGLITSTVRLECEKNEKPR